MIEDLGPVYGQLSGSVVFCSHVWYKRTALMYNLNDFRVFQLNLCTGLNCRGQSDPFSS